MKFLNLFFAILISISGFAQYTEVINSKRPGFSESPFSLGSNVYQIEGGYFYHQNNKPDFFSTRRSSGIDLFLRSGLLWEKFEVSANFKYQKDHIINNLVTGSTYPISGISQFTIGAKYMFYMPKYKDPSKEIRSWKAKTAFDWRRLIPSVGLYLGFNTDVLSKDYQLNYFSPKAVVLLQNDFSDDLVLITNFVGDYLTIGDKRTIGYIGTLTYSLTPKFSIFGEHQGMFTRYSNNFDFGGGLAYLINKDLQIGLNLRTDTQFDYLDIYGGLGLSYRIDMHKDKLKKEKVSNDGSGRIQYKKDSFFKRLFSKKSRRSKRPKTRKYRKSRVRKGRTKNSRKAREE